jgi:hypothetical protein
MLVSTAEERWAIRAANAASAHKTIFLLIDESGL